jgi:hypothetical protein
VEDTLNRLLLRYGVRRLEAQVRDLLAHHVELDGGGETWRLTQDDVPDLLALGAEKACRYQRRNRRDLFCLTPSPTDNTATYSIEGRPTAPMSCATCRTCDLPDTNYLCSNFLHPQIGSHQGLGGPLHRSVSRPICDLGKDEVNDRANCRADGHACWQRIVEAEPPTMRPNLPAGPRRVIRFPRCVVAFSLRQEQAASVACCDRATGPAALSLGCSNRAEFESRLSAIADIIYKLKVDNSLLSPNLPADAINGSLDKIERSLVRQLPSMHHPAVLDAIQTLRRVRGARNAIQHGRTEGGGLTATLRELGIHDTPPNWAAAWVRPACRRPTR